MLSQTLDWIAAHPVVTGAALVVSLALALIYGAIIYVAIGRMRPDYFIRDETASSAWRQRYPLMGVVALLLKNVFGVAVSYTHLTLRRRYSLCRSRWSPYH